MKMKKELEIVQHTHLNYLEVSLLDITACQPHGHDDLEIGVLLKGSLNLFLENEVITLKQGDIYTLNRYQVHSVSNTEGKNLLLTFQINSEFYRRLNPSLNFVQFYSNIIRSGNLHNSMYKKLLSCATHYFEKTPHYEILCASTLLNILYQLLSSTHCRMASEKECAKAQNDSIRLGRITDYIASHYTEKISLQDIADMENITVCHASHFIKNLLGISFQEYLNDVRFDHAYRLINHSDFSILDICMETGFSGSRYLNQALRKKLGCTVKEYMKAGKKQAVLSPHLPTGNIERHFKAAEAAKMLKKPDTLFPAL